LVELVAITVLAQAIKSIRRCLPHWRNTSGSKSLRSTNIFVGSIATRSLFKKQQKNSLFENLKLAAGMTVLASNW